MKKMAGMAIGTLTIGAGISWLVAGRNQPQLSGQMADGLRGVIVFQGLVVITSVACAFVKVAGRMMRGEKEICVDARSVIACFAMCILLTYYASIEMIRLILANGEFAWWRSPVLCMAMILADIWCFGLIRKFFPER